MPSLSLFETPVGPYLVFIINFLFLAELIHSVYANKSRYSFSDTLANFGIFFGVRILESIFLIWEYEGLNFFYHLTPLRITQSFYSIPLIFILSDFIYYWKHRWMHTTKFLWAFHVVHHSSTYLNLTTSYRLNWFQALVNFPFFIPLVLMGIDPVLLLILYSVSAVYQIFVHTETIKKLGILESIFNTPSHHRVHHGKNEKYLNKNFGGVFIIWDKLFGSFQAEEEKPEYGISIPVQSYNPLYLVFHGFIDWWKGQLSYRG